MIPPTYTFEKIDDIYYRPRVDNGCPWHVLRCNLGPNQIRELLEQLRELRSGKDGHR